MQWEFSADQVASGEVSYSLEEFRKDYYGEIKANFPEFDEQETDRMFRVAYDVCYCAATNRELSDLVEHLRRKEICCLFIHVSLRGRKAAAISWCCNPLSDSTTLICSN